MRMNDTYNGLEAIILENDYLRVVVIPELGGKISSLKRKSNQMEFLFQAKNKYMKPMIFDDFSLFQPSGIDDCFPNIDKEAIEVNGEIIGYPDHGEIWSASMLMVREESNTDKITFIYESTIFKYKYEKIISLKDDVVVLSHRVTNVGDKELDCFYTFHGLFRYEKNIKIVYPKDTCEILNVLQHELLGDEGTKHSFPITADFDFNNMRLLEKPDMMKFYVNHEILDGSCAIVYPELQTKVTIKYDSEKLPYLGVWITRGGFMEDYNIALEPSSGFYDSIGKAKSHKKLNTLATNESFEFELKLTLSDYF